jgi:hypothetical protein
MRKLLAVALAACIVLAAFAKDKKTSLAPVVLRATRVMVVVESSGTSLRKPGEDQEARTAVERALEKWGRFKVVYYANETDPADLVIAVRKGGFARPVLTGRSPNDRPSTVDATDMGVNIGISLGTPPPISSDPQPSGRPSMGTEVGSAEDSFAVYDGRMAEPLDAPALWRYSGKNALTSPAVPAVQEFRKAIEAAEKAQAGSKKP